MTTTLHITRHGGFAGGKRVAHVTDTDLRDAILAELGAIPTSNGSDIARDAFIYTFHVHIGHDDASAQADRNLREQHMTANLRHLLNTLTFGV